MRWFNLNTGIIILVIIIILLAIGMGIVGYSLWNVPKAKEFFPFLEISEVFPTKVVALFTGLATFGTLLLALATIVTIKNSNEQEKRRRKEELEKEKRDRKVQLLNDIINWAEDLASCSFLEKTHERHAAGNLLQRHRYFASKETYIRESVLFFENEQLSNALSRILDDKGSLRNVIDGLHALDIIVMDVENKEALREKETDNAKVVNLLLEMSKLSISASSKWIELTPIDQKLYEDVADLIEHASNIKIKLISEF